MNALKIAGLTFGYGDEPVIDGLSLDIASGETVALLGRSGTGKSTLLKCINLLLTPKHGVLCLNNTAYFENGDPLHKPFEVRRRIGLVFQDLNLFPTMTVRGNLTLGMIKVLGLSKKEADRRADDILCELGLRDLVNRRPTELSGGQAQRVALARAVVLRPQVLLLDEVTASLDPESVEIVTRTIRGLRSLVGGEHMAILIVTHLLPFAQSFADRICFMDEGRIRECHSAGEFAERASAKSAVSFIKSAQSGWIG